MRCRTALALGLSMVSVAACAQESPPMPRICTGADRAGYERALAGAVTGTAVRLPGGVPISECLRKVRTDAELQELGSVVHGVAEDLSGRARDGSRDAATQLGFLSGAVSAGAARSNGIGAELARRVENAAVPIAGDRALAGVLQAGAAAGAARG